MTVPRIVNGGPPWYKRLEETRSGPELNLAVVSCRSAIRYPQIEAVTSTSPPLQNHSFVDLTILTYHPCLSHDPR